MASSDNVAVTNFPYPPVLTTGQHARSPRRGEEGLGDGDVSPDRLRPARRRCGAIRSELSAISAISSASVFNWRTHAAHELAHSLRQSPDFQPKHAWQTRSASGAHCRAGHSAAVVYKTLDAARSREYLQGRIKMKSLKIFGLGALFALMVMAFLGASSAMAETTALCETEAGPENPCESDDHPRARNVGEQGKTIKHQHRRMRRLILRQCPRRRQSDDINGNFTYTNCGESHGGEKQLYT